MSQSHSSRGSFSFSRPLDLSDSASRLTAASSRSVPIPLAATGHSRLNVSNSSAFSLPLSLIPGALLHSDVSGAAVSSDSHSSFLAPTVSPPFPSFSQPHNRKRRQQPPPFAISSSLQSGTSYFDCPSSPFSPVCSLTRDHDSIISNSYGSSPSTAAPRSFSQSHRRSLSPHLGQPLRHRKRVSCASDSVAGSELSSPAHSVSRDGSQPSRDSISDMHRDLELPQHSQDVTHSVIQSPNRPFTVAALSTDGPFSLSAPVSTRASAADEAERLMHATFEARQRENESRRREHLKFQSLLNSFSLTSLEAEAQKNDDELDLTDSQIEVLARSPSAPKLKFRSIIKAEASEQTNDSNWSPLTRQPKPPSNHSETEADNP